MEREEIKGMTRQGDIARKEGTTWNRKATDRGQWKTLMEGYILQQKMARRHIKEGGNHLEQESYRQKTMEGTDGGLHPAVDGQSLGER